MRFSFLTGLLLILLGACNKNSAPIKDSSIDQALPQATAAAEEKTTNGTDVVLVGAGDIASCDDLAGAQATADLLDKIPGTVFTVGDLAYPEGTDEQFANAIMSITPMALRATLVISAPRQGTRRRGITDTTSVVGT